VLHWPLDALLQVICVRVVFLGRLLVPGCSVAVMLMQILEEKLSEGSKHSQVRIPSCNRRPFCLVSRQSFAALPSVLGCWCLGACWCLGDAVMMMVG
jgi:hypothetical protein